jgi:pimeloyl-ACP methyl ester carboxylesterase
MPGLAGAFAQNPWLGLCASWPVGRASPAEREAVRTDVPIVLLRGEFDPYTTNPDPAWLATMPHAYAYTFPGASYSPVSEGTSGCAAAIRAAFLDQPARAPDPACIGSFQEPSLVP